MTLQERIHKELIFVADLCEYAAAMLWYFHLFSSYTLTEVKQSKNYCFDGVAASRRFASMTL